jgi:polyketide cyclase/dehydrase/lipid transport protein
VIEVRRTTSAAPEAVWRVLADGWTYPSWVVGASRMRSVGTDWPAVGAELHHSLGVWPLLIDDVTRVLACEPERELLLRGKGWPLGEVRIHVLLRPGGNGGCEMVMREDVVAGPSKLIPKPVRVVMMKRRNTEALQRLAYLAEGSAR